MAAPDPDLAGEHILARFDAVASRMPDIARAVDAFDDEKLRERAYYELIGILNPDTEDGDTLPADVVRRLADATREEMRDGEEFGDVVLRLLDELRRLRAQVAERFAQERWGAPAGAEPDNTLTGAVQAYKDRTGI